MYNGPTVNVAVPESLNSLHLLAHIRPIKHEAPFPVALLPALIIAVSQYASNSTQCVATILDAILPSYHAPKTTLVADAALLSQANDASFATDSRN